MSLTAYGEFNPPPAIDPATYPHRTLITGTGLYDDGATLIMWLDADPLPMEDEDTEAVLNVLASKGAALVMAREAGVLERVTAFLQGAIRRRACVA